MTNYEKYKDELKRIIDEGKTPAASGGRLVTCEDIHCNCCDFRTKLNCVCATFKWFTEETGTRVERVYRIVSGFIEPEFYTIIDRLENCTVFFRIHFTRGERDEYYIQEIPYKTIDALSDDELKYYIREIIVETITRLYFKVGGDNGKK